MSVVNAISNGGFVKETTNLLISKIKTSTEAGFVMEELVEYARHTDIKQSRPHQRTRQIRELFD